MSFSAWTTELEQWLQLEAAASGFDAAGVSSVSSPPEAAELLTADRFTAWIDAGRAGEMDYLKRRDEQGVLLRSGIQAAIPWARSVIVCAFNYNTRAPLSIDSAPPETGWIARYAWSGSKAESQSGSEPESHDRRTVQAQKANAAQIFPDPTPDETAGTLRPTDYHHELLSRLRLLESALQQRVPCQTRCYVDTGPMIERAAAASAGIGWIGKNTCVINQRLGSWLLLGVIVTSLPIGSTVRLEPAADRCGSCTRCIDACPTDALIAPRQMDASRCISYLTIEKKGAISEELRPLMGRQVFGCDICQDVCPWNRRAPVAASPGMLPRKELVNPPLEWLAAMDAPAFRRYFKGSPVERTRRSRLLRNVAIAMGNSGQQQFLPILKGWSSAETSSDPILAEAAEWAIGQLEQKSGHAES